MEGRAGVLGSFWRSWLAPSTLGGVTASRWVRLLTRHGREIPPRYWPKAGVVTVASLVNSTVGAWEELRHRSRWEQLEVPAPLFVLGHWRSGTTFLHHLVACDPGLAVPTVYETSFPHTFLTTQALGARLLAWTMPRTRQIDRVPFRYALPSEDEYAVGAASLVSDYFDKPFPRHWRDYERHLSLRDASDDEVGRWKRAMLWFVRKLTLQHGRPLALKSPSHTCRIRRLLELFPDARFVHIRRNPYDVIRSCRIMWEVTWPWLQFQRTPVTDLDGFVLERYRRFHDVYFEEREHVPAGRLHELAFEDLERRPSEELRGMYEALALPGFERVEPRLEEYLESVRGYEKNVLPPLTAPLRRRIEAECTRSLEAWGVCRARVRLEPAGGRARGSSRA